MSVLTRPILEIDLNNLVENYKMLQKLAPKSASAAVVKDNAYGLDAGVVADVLYQEANCRNFFVAHAVEGEIVANAAPEAKFMFCRESAKTVCRYLSGCRSWFRLSAVRRCFPFGKKTALKASNRSFMWKPG